MSSSETEGDEQVQVVRRESTSSESSCDEQPPIGVKEGDMSVKEHFLENKMSTSPPFKPRMKRFLPKYDVEGVRTVILGEETQIQIEMVVGTHVTAQYPWKLVSKAKIMDTLDVGGELSEFYPIKSELENYSDEFILMGYIVDESKDVDEFYICCTNEARDHCKMQSDKFIRRQEKKLEKAVQKKPKPWTSLGSEDEINELKVTNTRPLFEIEVNTKFPTVYQPQKFHVRDANGVRDGYIELTPYRQKFYNVFRRRIDSSCQAVSDKVERAAQTVLRYPQNKWTQSIADELGKFDPNAGGDTGKVDGENESKIYGSDDDDEEERVKETSDDIGLASYRDALKRMRRPSYLKMINAFVIDKVTEMDSIVELNTVMDIYCNDYPNLVTKKTIDIFDSMMFEEYICYTDVRAKEKFISCAIFHPMWSGVIAISYADGSPTVMKSLATQSNSIQRAVYGLNPVMIWSHVDSLSPKLYLNCPREVKSLSFCPFDENILIGGCINGQIVLWDLTNKLERVETIEILSETKEKYRIAMNAHMGWMKNVQDLSVIQVTAMSNLITSHYAPVTVIKWLSPNFIVTPTGKIMTMTEEKTSQILLTGSEDGTILIWDLSIQNVISFESKKVKKSKRVPKKPSGLLVNVSPYKVLDRNWQPCYKIILGTAGQSHILPLQSLGMSYPVIDYIYTPRNTNTGRKYFTYKLKPQNDFNTFLYCGSQHGEVRKISWEGHSFNTGEIINSEYCDIKYSCCIHDGIISCTQKNPFLDHITLTIGGKIFAIWSDKLSSRPIIWKKRPHRLTDAAWSLYKPSLFFITSSEGTLETWDILLRSELPISVQTLSGTQLTGVSLHSLPLTKNIIGVSDANGSFRMFLVPPVFMIKNDSYTTRMESMMLRELRVKQTFITWQEEWLKNNPHVLLEMKRKEAAFIAEKEEEKRKLREADDKKLEEEAESQRLDKLKVIGREERWQAIINKLIERTIAVKKRINRQELIEQERPLRDLEAQRLEKERRMLDIMKNQKVIFNDTVAILFPEATIKPPKLKKSFLCDDKDSLKKEYLEDYADIKRKALKTVTENAYNISYSWDGTLNEGKERRQALCAHEFYIKLHKVRLDGEEK